MNTPSPRRRRALLVVLAFLGLPVVLLAVLLATLPLLASGPGARLASRWLERPVSVGALSVDPLELRLHLSDLRIGPWHGDGAAPPEFSLAQADVRLASRSLWQGYPEISVLHLAGPRLALHRDASGRLSIQDLLDRFTAPGPRQPAQALVLRDLLVRDGSLEWRDERGGSRHRLDGLQFELPFLSTRDADRVRPVEPRLYAHLDGRLLVLYGSARRSAEEQAVTAHFEVEDLHLGDYQDLFSMPPGLLIRDGRFDARMDLQLALRRAGLPAARLQGTLALRDVDLRRRSDGAPMLALASLEVPVKAADLDQRRLALGKLVVRGFAARATRGADGRIDWVELLKDLRRDAGQGQRTPGPASPAPQFSSEGVEFSGGRFDWQDARPVPAVHMAVRDASLTLGPLAWPDAAAVGFALSLQGDRKEALYLGGLVHPAERTLDAEARLERLDADRFSPYYAQRMPLRTTSAPFSSRARITAGLAPEGAWARIEGLEFRLPHLQLASRDGARQFVDVEGLEIQGLAADSRDGAAHAGQLSWQRLRAPLAGGQEARTGVVRLQGLAADWRAGRYQLAHAEAQALVLPGGIDAETLVGDGLDIDLGQRRHTLQSLAAAHLATPGGLRAEAIQLSSATADLAAGRYHAALLNAAGLAAPGGNRIDGVSLRDGDADLGSRHFQLGGVGGRGFALGGRFSVSSLDAGDAELDLAGHHVRLASLAAAGIRLQVVRRGSGTIDTGTLARAFAAVPATGTRSLPSGPTAAGDAPWHATIRQVLLDDCAGSFRDEMRPVPAEFRWNELSLRLAQVGTRLSRPSSVEASATLNESGRVSVHGALALDPLQGTLAIDAEALRFTDWLPWLPWHLPLTPTGGQAALSGDLRLAGQLAAPTLAWDGKARLSAVSLAADPGGAPLVGWNSLDVDTLHFNTAPLDAALGTVTVDGLRTRLQLLADGSFDLVRALQGGDAAASHRTVAGGAGSRATVGQRATPFPIAIARIELRNGSVAFSDRYVKPEYSARLENLQGSVSGLSSESGRPGRLELAGTLDGGASVRVSGDVEPLRSPLALDLAAVVRGFELGPLSSYSTRFTGYPIVRGKLSFDVHYRLDHGAITAANQLTLDQLTLGPRQEVRGIRQLPMDLAVSLLKDGDGVIQVDLPIQGTLDDPKFSFGSIVAQLVTRAVERAITAPFRWLGSLFGGEHAETLAWIGFAPGSDTLDATARDKLQRLAQALHARPALRLDIIARGDAALDAQALGEELFRQKLLVQKIARMIHAGQPVPPPDEVRWDPAETPALLADAWRQEHAGAAVPADPVRLESDLRASLRTGSDALGSLAVSRARAAQDWLTGAGGIDPARVFLVGDAGQAPAPQTPDRGIAPPASRVDFSVR